MEYNLKKENYQVVKAANGKEAINIAKKEHPDLILLDIMMPVMDGITACQQLRAMPEFKNTLIAFLTARNEDYSQIAGFESGADDYITKPVKPKVLVSRISALLRRTRVEEQKDDGKHELLTIGDLTIDREQYMIHKGSEKIILPRKEFELLALLAGKPGKVFTRDEILDKVWGNDIVVGDRTIDVHIRK